MANKEHLDLIKKGATAWNEWKSKNDEIINQREDIVSHLLRSDAYLSNAEKGDLSGANLSGINLSGANLNDAYLECALLNNSDLKEANLFKANLYGANLSKANLSKANLGGANLGRANFSNAYLGNAHFDNADLSGTYLRKANFSGANLSGANLSEANLSGANLSEANFSGANLRRANLSKTNLGRANLSEANLSEANLSEGNMVGTNFNKANLTGCKIYGISAWDLKLHETLQSDLIITPHGDSAITVDNLEVAQFVYLLLNNEKIRDVINTIGKKTVLILGRFTPERKTILDAIRNELRRLNYAPILFDFDKPIDKDFTETIMTLAGMCRFIIVDITNPKSSPLELHATVPNYMIPFVPIIQKGEQPFSMFKDLANKYEWIMDTLQYDSIDNLVLKLEKAVIKPALKKHDELMAKKNQELRIKDINDFL